MHENENVHGMIGQANWWHTRGISKQAVLRTIDVFFSALVAFTTAEASGS